jgi:hypothetical protein
VADAAPPPPPGTKRNRGPLLVVAIAAAVILGGVAIMALTGDDDSPKERAGSVVDDDGATTKAGDATSPDDTTAREGEKSDEVTGQPDPSDPQAYGDDATLDALYDKCKAGDLDACDQLYLDSGFGTKYEAFGDTCGGRSKGGAYCAKTADATGTGATGGTSGSQVSDGLADSSAQTYGDDPDLDRLWDACQAGDMTSCDSLYLSAPFGTPYEEFGGTCGHRNTPQGMCADLYG